MQAFCLIRCVGMLQRTSTPLQLVSVRKHRCVIARASSSIQQKVSPLDLLKAAEEAAKAGAQFVLANSSKPKSITRKEGNDVVTETDKASEAAIVSYLQKTFPGHAILGEEGGVLGEITSEYLWCLDPVDGTCNFSTGVLRHSTPVAGCVVEFLGGGPGGVGGWQTRTFTAARNSGAFLDGQPLRVSRTRELRDALVVTEAVYYEDIWQQLQSLHTTFTRDARGVRMSGAAAANLCHLAMGVVDVYYQFNLKPWDVAAGAVILEEAGGRITTADGTAWSPFDRSLLATNDALYNQVLKVTEPAMASMREKGLAELGPWCIPEGYRVRTGAQLG